VVGSIIVLIREMTYPKEPSKLEASWRVWRCLSSSFPAYCTPRLWVRKNRLSASRVSFWGAPVAESQTPLDRRSEEELKSSLRRGDFGARRKAFAQEILRRREEARVGRRTRMYLWLGAIIGGFSFGIAALSRLWRK
jgi:hypothetical protein